MNIEFNSEPVYGDNDKYIKTKIKMYEDRDNFPQTLLEECKYVIRKNKMENLINDDLDLSSSDESDNESENESDN